MAGCGAQQFSMLLACVRTWVQSPTLPQKNSHKLVMQVPQKKVSFFLILVLLGCTGFQTKGLALAMQAFYLLSQAASSMSTF
jgi:hypothetical protein